LVFLKILTRSRGIGIEGWYPANETCKPNRLHRTERQHFLERIESSLFHPFPLNSIGYPKSNVTILFGNRTVREVRVDGRIVGCFADDSYDQRSELPATMCGNTMSSSARLLRQSSRDIPTCESVVLFKVRGLGLWFLTAARYRSESKI